MSTRVHVFPKSDPKRDRKEGDRETCIACGTVRVWSVGADRWLYQFPSGVLMKHAPVCERKPS